MASSIFRSVEEMAEGSKVKDKPKSMNDTACKYVREKMPMLDLGTCGLTDKQHIFTVVDAALEAGYRFIDTSQVLVFLTF
jgi:hypothetical protein